MVRIILRIFIFSLALFLVLELNARIYYFGWSGLSYSRMNSFQAIGTIGYLRPSQYAGVVYELLPNLDGYFKLKQFQTNSQGLHDHEYAREKPANTFRVAVIGSSYTMGGGVEIEDVYHSRIEAELNRRRTPLRYEFINYAVGGYLPDQQLATLRHRALNHNPDLIIFAVTPRNAPFMFEQPGSRKREFQVHKVRYPFFRSFFLRYRLKKPDTKIEEMPGPSPVPNMAGQDIISHLQEIRRESNIPIVMLDLQYREASSTQYTQLLESTIKGSGIHWVSMREAFEDTDADAFWLYSFDQHPNVLAHKQYATVLGEYLENNKLLGQNDLITDEKN